MKIKKLKKYKVFNPKEVIAFLKKNTEDAFTIDDLAKQFKTSNSNMSRIMRIYVKKVPEIKFKFYEKNKKYYYYEASK